MRLLKEDGLVSSYSEYMLLDDRVLQDWRMYRRAADQKAANDAKRLQARSHR